MELYQMDIQVPRPGIGHNQPPPDDFEQVIACPLVDVAAVASILPERWFEQLAANAPRPCCKKMIDHMIEGRYTCQEEMDRGTPDLYLTHCMTCGNEHKRLMVGTGVRPVWKLDVDATAKAAAASANLKAARDARIAARG